MFLFFCQGFRRVFFCLLRIKRQLCQLEFDNGPHFSLSNIPPQNEKYSSAYFAPHTSIGLWKL